MNKFPSLNVNFRDFSLETNRQKDGQTDIYHNDDETTITVLEGVYSYYEKGFSYRKYVL